MIKSYTPSSQPHTSQPHIEVDTTPDPVNMTTIDSAATFVRTDDTDDFSGDDIGALIKHIAIIMDGNNRYAKARGMHKGQGHFAGKEALDPIVDYCHEVGIEVLTVFAFSSENWQRPPSEVALLMRLLSATINEQLPRMHENEISFKFIGDREQLSDELQQQMANAEAETAKYTTMTLVIAISYGGQWDIANAAKTLAKQVARGELAAEDITIETLGQHVQLGDMPDVDMLIRTGGEYRISNFLLWKSAYAELFFTDTLWPDFQVPELNDMFKDFAHRQRRFGKTSEQVMAVEDSVDTDSIDIDSVGTNSLD